MTEPTLYRWPDRARFGRVVPKTKFYEHGSVSSALRKRFVEEVQRITWAYKLADVTIHLAGSASVPEIQVFVVEAKDDDVSDGVLTAIDKAVAFPIIFEIARETLDGRQIRMSAAYKEPGTRTPKVGSYLSTLWLPDGARAPMPSAIDLPGLYRELLAPLLPVDARAGERLGDAAARVEQAHKLEREIDKLERRLRAEAQFNRKVDLRRRLLEHKQRLSDLTGPTPNAETLNKERQWTS